ncbi:MAG: DUF2807 domain-containing protein [Flavobacteriaceae bacterium]
MKNLAIIFTMSISLLASSQKGIEKKVGEFQSLKVYDLIEVKLIKSDENKIVILGKNTEDVLFVNKDGKLKIRMALEKIFNGEDTRINLYYTNVDVLDANEGAYIHSEDEIKQYEIDLNAQEGAFIKVKIDVTYANIRSVTGASVHAYGKAKHQDVSIYTGGTYKAEHLETEFTDVSIRAAGEAYVNASTLVNAKVRAGGDIYIYGNPERVDENKVLGGRIKRMD